MHLRERQASQFTNKTKPFKNIKNYTANAKYPMQPHILKESFQRTAHLVAAEIRPNALPTGPKR